MKNQSSSMLTYLKDKIQKTGQHISFADYMATALYHPKHGYYTAQSQQIGESGDFITSSEISREFSLTIAKFCEQQLAHVPGDILEFGAGNGTMAATIIAALPETAYRHYYIVDISPALRQRQYELIQQTCPDKLTKVIWLDDIPENFSGVILANEVLDAMPVTKFKISQQQIEELVVTLEEDELKWLSVPANQALRTAVAKLIQQYQLDDDYESEINLYLNDWFATLDSHVNQAVMLMIDYGYPGVEYYHPARKQGTIMCHQKHHAHPDPLYQPGQQDITAHVDFSYVAEVSTHHAWQVEQFTTQAYFLLEMGLIDFIPAEDDWQAKQAIKKLTLPHEMGELFKVMVLSKQVDIPQQTSPWPSLLNRL